MKKALPLLVLLVLGSPTRAAADAVIHWNTTAAAQASLPACTIRPGV